MSEVFDPEVEITQQALDRRERFRLNKEKKLFDVEPVPEGKKIPTIYFDDLGNITAVTYDPEFIPDQNWKTYDFDPSLLKMIKNKSTSRYVITRVPNDSKTVYKIEIRNKYNQHRELTVDTSLMHVKKLAPDTDVDILIKVQDDTLEFSLTESGKEAVENSEITDIKLHITGPLNPHLLYETLSIDLAELAQGPVVKKTSVYCELKSLYAQRPFAYGRV